MKKIKILITVWCLFGIVVLINQHSNAKNSEPNNNIILIFENPLLENDFKTISSIVKNRLKLGKIKVADISYNQDSLKVEIKESNQQIKAKEILKHQGDFKLSVTFDNRTLYPIFIEINDNFPINENQLLFDILEPEVFDDGNFIEGAIIGSCEITDTPDVIKFLNSELIKTELPENLNFAWQKSELPERFELIALNTKMDLSHFDNHSIQKIDITENWLGKKEIRILFNKKSAKDFWELTKNNAGNHIAIMLDDIVLSAPMVLGAIPNGMINIGHHDEEKLKSVFYILKTGQSYPLSISKILDSHN